MHQLRTIHSRRRKASQKKRVNFLGRINQREVNKRESGNQQVAQSLGPDSKLHSNLNRVKASLVDSEIIHSVLRSMDLRLRERGMIQCDAHGALFQVRKISEKQKIA